MLTDRELKGAQCRSKKQARTVWLTESLGHGRGSLLVKCTPLSVHCYYRYVIPGGTDQWPMGNMKDLGSLKGAREHANKLAQERHKVGNLRAQREEQERAKAKAEEDFKRTQEAARAAEQYTVAKLCEIYGGLRGADAANSLKNITKSQYATLPARELTRKQVAEILRGIIERGKGRTAAKARSYLHAAYALALNAEGDANAPSSLLPFDIQTNPVVGTSSLSQFNKSRDRALSEAEARAYWKHIKGLSGTVGDAIKLQYLTGGQRFKQLLRAEVKDVDLDESIITLYDRKGRRTTARPHAVPLCTEALEIVKGRLAAAEALESKYLFTTYGKVPLNFRTISIEIKAILKVMEKAGELSSPAVPSDLRRTVETRLAALGISKETRGQLQSHGLSGVQARHYDRHDYLNEKRAAIVAWLALLNRCS